MARSYADSTVMDGSLYLTYAPNTSSIYHIIRNAELRLKVTYDILYIMQYSGRYLPLEIDVRLLGAVQNSNAPGHLN